MKPYERYIDGSRCSYCRYLNSNDIQCNECELYDGYVCRERDHCETYIMRNSCAGCGLNYHIKKQGNEYMEFYVSNSLSYLDDIAEGIEDGLKGNMRAKIKNVIFNDPATIVFWSDGTKTVVKVQEDDVFDPEKGLAMAIAKKAMGNKGRYYNEIKKWTKKEEEFQRDFKDWLETLLAFLKLKEDK